MIALIQRVLEASVDVGGERIAQVGHGMLLLYCAERGDAQPMVEPLVERVLDLRIFADERGRMNLSLRQVGGALLVVPQFTLAAELKSGNRPSFSRAAPPEFARECFERFASHARKQLPEPGRVQTGRFGADMQVRLLNDGPVTIELRTPPEAG